MYARFEGCGIQSLRDRISFVPDRPGHDVRYALDDRRLRAHTGWQPRVAFEEGLERTVAWYLSHRAWLEESVLRQSPGYYDSVYVRGWRRE
jgi:dTDP-glucose 4,6-dehydratase